MAAKGTDVRKEVRGGGVADGREVGGMLGLRLREQEGERKEREREREAKRYIERNSCARSGHSGL